MNKRNIYGGDTVTKSLPCHLQTYVLTRNKLKARYRKIHDEFYRNGSDIPDRSLYQKRNNFKRIQLESKQILCHHCRKEFRPGRGVTNRNNLYHVRCAILVGVLPHSYLEQKSEQVPQLQN